MTILVVGTGNPGKLKEMQEYLIHTDWQLQLKPKEIDVEETGTTFLENACLKASQTAIATGQWSIADDSGLSIDALDGAPGIYSARYADTDAKRIERVLQELADKPNRGAQFVCAIAVARPDGKIMIQEEGICRGEILKSLQGQGGFGYDPIFYVPPEQQTFAAMSAATKHRISHRGCAFALVLPQLQNLHKQIGIA
ncbi:RdgB/HAM1 family non-canonical purine NTP pyrophosphatase [filamentous cyanobacterium LEGE 11480]|uniref:dITP/XTP pyrophosphatase n=1 Tax=Romeriopsis navalis LEGE 11480 TaxID=2777977 RepID=A0A928VTR1_9CYAN|nr:RdgB/HAM1 family non-canonical purine NTP pyrophosphatase [Romeriopsis navalis]MBE9032891.1 RdgB/HAM1 family non-canonical purine NTP pyrophosphatase [Romeriopsis navalis LEGE 11480]